MVWGICHVVRCLLMWCPHTKKEKEKLYIYIYIYKSEQYKYVA